MRASSAPFRLVLAAALALAALPASAQCFADYKAKKDNPLRLQYGVMKIPESACDPGAAEAVVAGRLADAGWTLLNVLSVFGPEGLEERKDNAGKYFLRY